MGRDVISVDTELMGVSFISVQEICSSRYNAFKFIDTEAGACVSSDYGVNTTLCYVKLCSSRKFSVWGCATFVENTSTYPMLLT